jgi:hypothetical protein
VTRLRSLCCALVCSLVLAGVPAAGALASHSQSVFFEAPGLLLNPATRQSTVAVLQRLGVNALRVELSWHTVAPQPNSSRRPVFDATDPAAYKWGYYDPLIEEGHRLGWKVLLTVASPVPRWATANPRSGSLVNRPSSRQFEQFMTAVGRHYAGEISLFAIWNEPNHHEFLEPQFNANGTPASPLIYRSLFQAGYAGLQAAGIVHPAVLIGETAPEGEAYASPPVRAGSAHNVGPLIFLRDTLCLTAGYRRSRSCGSLHPSGWAIHPYSGAAGPLSVPRNPESVTIGSLDRITGALDLAARAHAVPAHLPVYITEFGVMSKPNRYQGVPVAQQAEYGAMSERVAYENPRVASFSQYLLRDDAASVHRVSFQTGLEYVNGTPKPLFAGFPLPLTVSRRGHSYVLWGHVRPADSATTVTVEAERPGSRRFTTLSHVVTNGRAYWQLYSTVSASRWRVRWTSPTGAMYVGPPIRAY